MQVFKIEKNDRHLSFNIEKDNSLFGDGTKIVFWIDLETAGLQRGRQEHIPLSSISFFKSSDDGLNLVCDLNKAEMNLYQGIAGEENQIADAVKILNEFCGF